MLNSQEIKQLINDIGLVSEYIDLDMQLTPNGIDLTASQLWQFSSPGCLDFSNKERVLPEYKLVQPQKMKSGDLFGWWHLSAGAYKVVTNERIALPRDLIGMAFPRSSLLRMGMFTQTGVWDAGFAAKVSSSCL